MPLILGLHEGEQFAVGDNRFVVSFIAGKFKFKLTRHDGREFMVSDLCSTEVADDVFITCGLYPQNGVARVSIDAPRELAITRQNFKQEADT